MDNKIFTILQFTRVAFNLLNTVYIESRPITQAQEMISRGIPYYCLFKYTEFMSQFYKRFIIGDFKLKTYLICKTKHYTLPKPFLVEAMPSSFFVNGRCRLQSVSTCIFIKLGTS